MDGQSARQSKWPRKEVALNIGLLGALVAAERVVFKALADSMDGHGYVLVQLATAFSAASAFSAYAYKRWYSGAVSEDMTSVSLAHICAMALLDAARVFMTLLVAAHVPGVLTVLLLQPQQPVTMLLSACLRGQREYSARHYLGALVCIGGALLAAAPQLDGLSAPAGADRVEAWNSLVYLLALLPAALSAMYKEWALRATPVDLHYLLSWELLVQLLLGFVCAALGYRMQGIGDDWGAFPASQLDTGISEGLRCWAGGCRGALPLFFAYLAVTAALPLAVTRTLDSATPKAVYVAFIGAVPAAALALALLDGALGLAAAAGGVVVVAGLALYHSLPEPHIELLTGESSDDESSEEEESGSEQEDEESPQPAAQQPHERTPLNMRIN